MTGLLLLTSGIGATFFNYECPRANHVQSATPLKDAFDAAGFPEAPRSASKARAAVIEIVNGWLDGQTLTDEQLEKGWEHYLIENAEDSTQDMVVFFDIGSVHF